MVTQAPTMEPEICYDNFRGTCTSGTCDNVHHEKPYLWQIKMDQTVDWRNLQNEGDQLEKRFTDPSCQITTVTVRKCTSRLRHLTNMALVVQHVELFALYK